ncbi:MAG: MupG family TIM beta-alpha barrel fold protein [Bifidobacteriaceae bacterium]|nr:MupG family TIM beta-alpha barrel fold protein [Bifidobacteriaceae bacterium]
MANKLGISIYPEHSKTEDNKVYIDKAGKAGFKRVFTCLLSVEGKTPDEVKAEFREMIDDCHKYDMEVIMDVAPYVFDRLGISYDDLGFFSELGADGIRLDQGFDGLRESMLTYNKYGLYIEVNGSMGNDNVGSIVSNNPNMSKFLTCHNFYPQRYTGLDLEFFNHSNEKVKKYGLNTAAFVSSQAPDTFGPWPVREGLCTLEIHRNLPIDVQVRHLVALGNVDDILIGNQAATDEELEIMGKTCLTMPTFKIDFEKELHESERKVIYEHEHMVRGDKNDYMARSSWPRMTYKHLPFPAGNTRPLKRGDVVILNDNYAHYKGELQIILKDMPNEGNKNVVGHVPENERMLLDSLDRWRPFGFVK